MAAASWAHGAFEPLPTCHRRQALRLCGLMVWTPRAQFELPGCVTSYADGGTTCGRKVQAANHGEGGDHGHRFVTGVGRGVANVLIEDVRLNDALNASMDPHAAANASASWAGFWSAMAPDGSAHSNITFRRVVAMRTLRDGVRLVETWSPPC